MIESRKEDHMKISLREDVEVKKNYWNEIDFYHRAAPEIDFDEIDLSTEFLGVELEAPLIIAGMTGGYEGALDFNKELASAAENTGIGFGVGSQRAAIENPDLKKSYEAVSSYSVPLVFGNLGAPQLVSQDGEDPFTISDAKKALDMIDGDFLAVHFNYLQEAVQPEGDLKAEGVLDALKSLSSEVPTIAKETGAGVSTQMALAFRDAGVRAIDVGGKGGTSFSAVEHYRNKDKEMKEISKNLWDWGIPTPASLMHCRGAVSLPLIATGGIKNGIEVAKAIAMGADVAGIAGGVLRAFDDEKISVVDYIEKIKKELKITMFLLGCSQVEDLLQIKKVVKNDLKAWID